jgi:hypothetical protein
LYTIPNGAVMQKEFFFKYSVKKPKKGLKKRKKNFNKSAVLKVGNALLKNAKIRTQKPFRRVLTGS